ncbi:MAG TPA: exosortase/archaeosortase family protein, partial [Anaerolineae bacterium]|nr:exosortase/archaeosortase family protein [Anaerolineae bacterium]
MTTSVHRRSLVSAAFIGALLLLIFYPTLRWLANEWMSNDYYSHGLLVPFISAFFVWRLWPHIGPRQPSDLGMLLLAAGLILYLGALFSKAYFIASFGIILLLAGLVWFLIGTRALRVFAFPLGFLVFMIPLPFVERSSLPLAFLTGKLAAMVVRFLGVEITVHGNQVILPSANLVVGAQCSGVRSIVTLFTLVAIFIFVLRGPWWGKLVLALSAIPVAAVGNVARVASLLIVANGWGTEAGFNFYHNYTGLV